MVGRRAGRRDRIIDALDLEPGGERRRRGRGHRLRHGERADALRPLRARDVGGLDERACRGAARAHDDAGALVRDVAGRRGRRRGSPDPSRRGSRPCRRRGSAWRGDRRCLRDRASARREPGSGSRVRRTCRRATMPDLASRSEASTSWVLLPIEETMPMPVTTTRLMLSHCSCVPELRCGRLQRTAGCQAQAAGQRSGWNRPTRRSLAS